MNLLHALRTLAVGACLLAASAPAPARAPQPAPVYSPAALQQDLQFMREQIDRIHPEPGLYVSRETLRKSFARVETQLQQPLNRDQAWRAFSALNPVFADGHMFVVYPGWEAQARAHLAAGGSFFPYEVQVDADGGMAIVAELGGGKSALAGTRIERINGVPVSRLTQELLGLMGGETPMLRAHLLSRRMWFYYWKAYGAPAQFDLVLASPDGPAPLRVAGSRTPPTMSPKGEDGFRRTYRFELLPGKAALLTINHFDWPDEQAFYAFTKDAFTRIRDAGVKNLIIDVRENPGGNDDMWKMGVLPYLADKPFRNASSYIKKVLAGRQSGTEQVGDVVHGFGDTWIQPDTANPLHYTGKTYVLVGRITYSSAVLFSNVVQDFGFGKLVGAGGYARTRQTGGVQRVILPNTGLEITIPRFVVDRPSGEREPALVHPDIVLPDSPFDRRETVNALLDYLGKGTPAATVASRP